MDSKTAPYVGPQPFKESQSDRFFGRKREARELLALVLSEQLVVFYAQSGSGKTSLVNTRLIPKLREKGFEVLKGRVIGNAPRGVEVENIFVFNLLRSLAPGDAVPETLRKLTVSEFLSSSEDEIPPAIEADEERVHRRRALIIDQFEELFSTHPEAWEQRQGFFEQLAEALESDPYLWVTLVMRDDYIASLDPYASFVPGRFRKRYYMQRLERDRALEPIKGPAEKFHRPFVDQAAETLVDRLARIKVPTSEGGEYRPGQFVEPVHLQVVCQDLWQRLQRLSPSGTQITEKDIDEVGDLSTPLGNYYAEQVKKVAEEKNVSERRIRRWIAEKLISPGGIRTLVLQDPGKESSGLENEIIQALPYLIRIEQRGGSAFYELTHDSLVDPILTNNKEWEKEHSSLLQRQAALWKEQKENESLLLTDLGLTEVEQWATENPMEVGEDEKDFLRASRDYQEHIDAQREYQRRELRLAQEREQEQKRFAEEQERLAQRYKRLGRIAQVLALVAFVSAIIAAGFAVVYANRFLNIKKDAAEALLSEAASSHDLGRYEESASRFLTAQALDPNVVQTMDEDATVLSNFCSDGSLFTEDASKFAAVCDRAVSRAPADGLIHDKRGINRVLLGDLSGAAEDFEYAVNWYKEQQKTEIAQTRQAWIDQINAGENPFDQNTLNELKARALAESAAQLNNTGQYEEMIKSFLEAQRLEPSIVEMIQDGEADETAGFLNNICWWGSLFRYPREVDAACERAVQLAPADGGIIDSRGLNRALLKEYDGAIEDFKVAVIWFRENKQSEELIARREAWIAALTSGQNPFDDATLEALKLET